MHIKHFSEQTSQLQKQPSRGVFRKRCSIYRCKFTGEHPWPCRSMISIKFLCNVIEITLWRGFSPVNFLHLFRTPFSKNISGRLLLHLIETFENFPSIDTRKHFLGLQLFGFLYISFIKMSFFSYIYVLFLIKNFNVKHIIHNP